jgi:Flp pilus assembly protein TadD
VNQANDHPSDRPLVAQPPASPTWPEREAGQALQGINGCLRFWSSGAWWFGLFLVTATFLVYSPALPGKFLWDDNWWTTNIVGLLRDPAGLWTMWWQPAALQQYYPLTGTTFWFDYHLWGSWTLPYHVENVLLHAFAALLFWRLLRRLEVPGAWLAAAIFALHPVMVESVAWISERKNVLSLPLYLGALLAYGRFANFWKADAPAVNSPSPLRGAYGLALLLFVAADLAKATAVSLPAVLLLVCWWKRGRIRWRADVLPSLPFFAVALGLGLVTAWSEKICLGAKGPEWALSFPERCLIAGRALWFYAGKLLWPVNLCFLYPRWHPNAGSFAQWLCPGTAAGVLLVLWLLRGRIGRGPATAAFFFAGTLFPVLGFMDIYFMRYSFVADHWMYLSSLGLIALGAALAAGAAARMGGPALLRGTAVVLLPVLGVLTWQQSRMYTDPETLWRSTNARNPTCWLADNILGYLLLERGQVDEALPYFEKALALQPLSADDHTDLAYALLRKGRVDESITHSRKALAIRPAYVEAYNNLGRALLQKGQVDEALASFRAAVKLRPGNAPAHNNLGKALLLKGREDEAIAHFAAALAIQPTNAPAHNNLATLLLQKGHVSEAMTHYQAAVDLQPGNAEILNSFAWVLATSPDASVRNGAKAVDLAQRAARLSGARNPWILGTLAAADAEAGQFPEAVATARQALELASPQANTSLVRLLQTQIKLYQAGSPFRDTDPTNAGTGSTSR